MSCAIAHAPRFANGTRLDARFANAFSRWSAVALLGCEVSSRETAVHQKGGRSYVRRLVACQEESGLRDLACLGEAPHRQVNEATRRLLGIVREELLEKWRVDRPGTERVHAHT